jgi:hypothetical protein
MNEPIDLPGITTTEAQKLSALKQRVRTGQVSEHVVAPEINPDGSTVTRIEPNDPVYQGDVIATTAQGYDIIKAPKKPQ